MQGLTYENQGTETMLVYQLSGEEHLDHFAKGMLQSNEMVGILRPSFMQRDMDQYLKFPVTSRIPLKEFLQGEMERETMLKLCLSITGAVREIEEYMLSPEKILMDPEYIFVEVRKKEASLLYLPVDEYSQDVSVQEFLLGLLSHTRYQLDQDVSYVAKLIHFLNGPKAREFEELQRFVQGLMNTSEEENGTQPAFKSADKREEMPPVSSMPPVLPVSSMPPVPPVSSMPPVPPVSSMPPAPPASSGGFNPIAQDLDMPKKKGLFVKKEKKEKAPKPDKKHGMSAPAGMPNMQIPGTGVPNMQIPGAGVPNMQILGQKQPEVVLNVDEQGNYLADQTPVSDKKKGGLFSFGKKKKETKQPVPPTGMPVGMPVSPVAPMQEVHQQQPQPQFGQQGQFGQQPQPQFGQQGQFGQQPQQSYQQAQEGATVYIGHGSSDDSNRTVIMGGGKDYGSTVVLGAGGDRAANVPHHVVRITRRRTGQSMVINKDLFRIGSEASFVDFFIGDNPAIGSCHADIFEDGGAYYITDRNSVNHTYVNGIMAQPMQSVQLDNGTVIRLADEDFDFIIS